MGRTRGMDHLEYVFGNGEKRELIMKLFRQ